MNCWYQDSGCFNSIFMLRHFGQPHVSSGTAAYHTTLNAPCPVRRARVVGHTALLLLRDTFSFTTRPEDTEPI